MPRTKKPKPQPIDSFDIQVDDEDITFEVWDNRSDAGTRGAHMRLKRDKVFDAALKYFDDALAGNSNLQKQKIDRLINGQESLIAFGKIIMTIAKQNKVPVGKTLAEKIAKSVRNHFKAVDAAIAKKAEEP